MSNRKLRKAREWWYDHSADLLFPAFLVVACVAAGFLAVMIGSSGVQIDR
jgi:hypothetical protein